MKSFAVGGVYTSTGGVAISCLFYGIYFSLPHCYSDVCTVLSFVLCDSMRNEMRLDELGWDKMRIEVCTIMSCQARSCHAIPCDTMRCHVMPCSTM